jgi:hypothetical protein
MFAGGGYGNIVTNGRGSLHANDSSVVDLTYAGGDTFVVTHVTGTVIAP